MVRTFFERMHERDSRRLFFGLFFAKVVGTAMALVGGWYLTLLIGEHAGAESFSKAAVKMADSVNATNTAWVLVAAFLVFFMQAGFMMLEAGFAREREMVNILLECIVDTCLCGVLFYAFGFAFMFGDGNGFIGHTNFFLQDAAPTYGTTGVSFMAFFLFQFAFADTCSTITSGAMVGRTGFVGDLLYSLGVSGFIYPIIGHWIWGPNGWLETMSTPFRDFAGSTVVHTVGGMLALAGAIALGPRLGRKFKRDGGAMPPGHDMTIAAVGGIILWFGWYGFNPGSTLSALDLEGIGRVATNTTLAACAGGLVAMAFVYPRIKKWDAGITINGFLAGLVAITAPCYWVTPTGSLAIGAIAGVVMVIACRPPRALPDRRSDRRVAGPRCVRHLGHARPRPVRLRRLRDPRPDGADLTTRSAASSAAAAPSSWALSSSAAASARRWRSPPGSPSCSASRPPAPSGSPRPASSRASTSTSTARRPTTRSSGVRPASSTSTPWPARSW